MTPRRLITFIALVVSLLVASAGAAAPAGRRHRRPASRSGDVMIPMRDGVTLHTKIFTPKNQSGAAADHP